MVMESTYGGSRDFQPKRSGAEKELERIVRDTIERKGRVIIPTFAVGRSQEVILVLEEAVRSGRIPDIPIYLDGMIDDATNIHITYPEYLNRELQNLIFHKGHNPFNAECFKPVDSQNMRQQVIDNREPCVVLATSGMLNGGPVMEYLKAYGPEENNSLVFVGYQAEGTQGRRLQKGWNELSIYHENRMQVFKMGLNVLTVDGFSGHSDRQQLLEFVRRMNPKPERILTSHGDENKCMDLASTIYRQYKLETRAPQNLETVRFI
jgi:predicted metal-dependent RNase